MHSHGLLHFRELPITLTADFSLGVTRARAVFMEVKRLLRGQQGVCYGLLFPAHLPISHGQAGRKFMDPEKALAYVRIYIISAAGCKDQKIIM